VALNIDCRHLNKATKEKPYPSSTKIWVGNEPKTAGFSQTAGTLRSSAKESSLSWVNLMEDEVISMQILVVGAGAVGGYLGGRLAEAGRDVTFLARPRRAEILKKDGLQIIGSLGNTTLWPKCVMAAEIRNPYDLVLLSVKSYSMESALQDFAPAVGPDTMILPTLNGIRHIEQLSRRFGERSVLGGVCLVAAELDERDRIVQTGDMQELSYGELTGSRSARIQSLDTLLQQTGFQAYLSEHIVPDMWQKWVQLASLGAATCLMRGNIGQIVAVERGASLCSAILDECAAIAASDGFPQNQGFLERHRAALTGKGSSLTSSMYRDLKNGAPVEVDTILGDLLRHADEGSLLAPLLNAAFAQLSIYQTLRRAT
jgi:2-dehydropantoate 2-reductase